jgi:hypothetical protein
MNTENTKKLRKANGTDPAPGMCNKLRMTGLFVI